MKLGKYNWAVKLYNDPISPTLLITSSHRFLSDKEVVKIKDNFRDDYLIFLPEGVDVKVIG